MTSNQDTSLADIAATVNSRAAALMPPEPGITVTADFVAECLAANERGDGCLFATLNHGKFLVNTTPKQGWEWYTWDNHIWRTDDTRRSFAAAEEVALEYDAQREILQREIMEQGIDKHHRDAWKIAAAKNYRARVDRLRRVSGVENCLKWAPIVDESICVRESDFDRHPMLLPCHNGVIDLTTGVLQHGRPADKLTRCIDLDYDHHADYQPWQEFINEICNDNQELASFVKRSLGYAITGHSREQYIWVWIGPGRNGKGVLFNLIGEVLGPYCHQISPAMIVEQRNPPAPAAASEHLYSLLGKRLIIAAETEKNQKISRAGVKQLTGEDTITCRPLFRGELNFAPTHTLMLHTNHMPGGLTADFALLQRLLKIELPLMYVDNPQQEAAKNPLHADRYRAKDPRLKERLRAYKPGILRWLVEGCLEWQQQGISPPPIVADWVQKEATEADYYGLFLSDCVDMHEIVRDRPRMPATELYHGFLWWWSVNMDSRENRYPALKTLTAELRNRGHRIEKASGKYWAYGMTFKLDVSEDIAAYKLKS